MKRLIPYLLVGTLGFVAGAFVMSYRQGTQDNGEPKVQRTAWETEKADLENALASARRELAGPSSSVANAKPADPNEPKPTPDELLRRLAVMKCPPGQTQGRAVQQILATLGELARAGPEALPAIRQFLGSNADAEYESISGKGMRDIRSLTNSALPPSLRLALFDVLRQIGGEEAQKLLAETLGRTGRGFEVAYLTQMLEEMAPGKYRDNALAAAQTALSGGDADRVQRDHLFSVLRRFNDTSFVSTAQGQLVQADGKVDRSALRYLQQSLGEQSVAVAAQFYNDARITEPDSREPLARLALTYVGASDRAAQLWHTAINDPALKPGQRRELILDLDQDGLQNDKVPTPTDLPIVANRLALIEAYLQEDYVQSDSNLSKAFLEAQKDLLTMFERGTVAAKAGGTSPVTPAK